MTTLHISALAVFCLMLAGLCRWFGKLQFKASTDERFRCLFEYAAVAMSIVDSDRRFVHVNRAYSELLGYDTSELHGSPLTMVTHPEDISEHLVWWDEMFRHNERSSAQDKRYIRKDGRLIWVRVTANLFTPSDGTASLVMAVVENITERKQAEQALRQSEARYLGLIEAIPQQVWTARPDGTLDYVNRRVLDYFDASAERLLDWEWQSVLHPDDLPACMTAWTASLQTGEPYEIEFRLRQADDGVYRWHLARALPIKDEAGQIVKWFGTNTDITGRRQVEEALRESEQRHRSVVTAMAEGIVIQDRNGRIVSCNASAYRILGLTEGEMLGRTLLDPQWQAIREDGSPFPGEIHPTMETLRSGRASENVVMGVHRSDRSLVWISVNTQPMLTAGSELPSGVVASFRDITAQKLAEENLQCTRFAMDQAVDAVYWIDPNARILYTNDAARAMLGYTEDEFLRMTVHDLNPNFPPEMWLEFWEETREKKVLSFETLHLAKDGRRIPIDIRVSFLAYGGKEFHCAFVRNISERKQTEAALRRVHEELEQRVVKRTAQLAQANRYLQEEIAERKRVEEQVRDSELRYKLLTEATFDGIAIHDQGVLIEVNAGLERIFGYGPGELIGRSLWDLVADESRELILANMRNGVNGPYEAMGRRKDGTIFPGEVVVRPYCYRGKNVRLVAGRDITERKHLEAERIRQTEELERQVAERTAEIAKLESQRAQTEKLAAMGRLAAGVAHEINNPIAGIKNAFTLVKQAVDPNHPHAEFTGMIDREIARVASIVQNMYQLYRPESGKPATVEFRTMVNDIEALFAKRLQQHRLVLAIDVDSCIERLCVPRGDLLQVLLNLLNNAIDCSNEGATIMLTLRVAPEAIQIAVSDEGPGIPPEHLPHIFDPFFTTKTGGDQKGMGLGLSISQSLVMAMGGKIEVQTQPNGGSTFSVLLPRHTAVDRSQDQSDIIKEVVTL